MDPDLPLISSGGRCSIRKKHLLPHKSWKGTLLRFDAFAQRRQIRLQTVCHPDSSSQTLIQPALAVEKSPDLKACQSSFAQIFLSCCVS